MFKRNLGCILKGKIDNNFFPSVIEDADVEYTEKTSAKNYTYTIEDRNMIYYISAYYIYEWNNENLSYEKYKNSINTLDRLLSYILIYECEDTSFFDNEEDSHENHS